MPHLRSTKRRSSNPRPKSPLSRFGGLTAIARQHAAAEDRCPMAGEDQTDLGIAYWISFNAMTGGASSEEHWAVVVVALNTAIVLCECGFGKEYEPYIAQALEGAFRAQQRAGRTGAWRFDGPALCAVRTALEVHDEQIKSATREDLRQAVAEVHRRIQNGITYQEAA